MRDDYRGRELTPDEFVDIALNYRPAISFLTSVSGSGQCDKMSDDAKFILGFG